MPDNDARMRLAEDMFNDPDGRAAMEDWAKKKYPNAPNPGADLRATRASILADVEERLKKDREDLVKERQQRDLDLARREVMDDPDLRIRADEIESLEKLMLEEGIATHKAAAKYHRALEHHGVARPRPSADAYSTMSVPGLKGAGGDEFKGLVEDPDGWARERAQQIYDDFANGNGSRWL